MHPEPMYFKDRWACKPGERIMAGQNTKKKSEESFTEEEKAAMRDRAAELKSAKGKVDGEKDVLEKIAQMPEPDQSMAKRLHNMITTSFPDLAPKTWYGMPAYSLDGKLICFFQNASKFKARYATLGFTDKASLDEGSMWPTSFALQELTPEVEERIKTLIRNATR